MSKLPKPTNGVKIVRGSRKQYPYLFDTETFLIEDGYSTAHNEGYLVQYNSREDKSDRIRLRCYKGSMLLECAQFVGSDGEREAKVWLGIDDIDTLITMLRDARFVLANAYRKAQRQLAKNLKDGTPSPDAKGHTPGGRRARRKLGMRDRIRKAKRLK